MTSDAIRCPLRLSSCMSQLKVTQVRFRNTEWHTLAWSDSHRVQYYYERNVSSAQLPGTFFVPALMFQEHCSVLRNFSKSQMMTDLVDF